MLPRFPRIGLAERDDADGFAASRVCDEEDAAFDFAERIDSDFAIVLSPVFPFETRVFENVGRKGKRKTALVPVLFALRRVEFEVKV